MKDIEFWKGKTKSTVGPDYAGYGNDVLHRDDYVLASTLDIDWKRGMQMMERFYRMTGQELAPGGLA